MRVAATVCAGALVACVAVAGVVLAHKPSLVGEAPEFAAPARAPAAVVNEIGSAATSVNSLGLAAATAAAASGSSPAESPAASALVVAQAPSAASTLAGASPPPGRTTSACAVNPNMLGVARTVEIDTTGGPGFGFEHFKEHDFLREGEVVLTFDDGPWPKHTPAVLAALRAHCTKAIFFPIGLHATYEPGIMKQVAADGHAIGSHTWCHQDLSKTKGKCLIKGKLEVVEYDPQEEIEKGISAVRWAAGMPTAPYFRFPALRQPPELMKYLGERNIAMFSTDFDSFDFKMRKPEQVRQAIMTKLKKHGKGIILMHDFQQATAAAAADLLNDLKTGGYKVVFMKPKDSVKTIASYDELVMKQVKPSTGDGRPTSSVVRTVE